jgi:hypothetical protein
MNPTFDFHERVAVLTGSGMGLATTQAFAESGAAVVLADRDEQALRTAKAELTYEGRAAARRRHGRRGVDRLRLRRRAARARARRTCAPAGAAPVLLEECQGGQGLAAHHPRRPRLLGVFGLPQLRGPRTVSEVLSILTVSSTDGKRGSARVSEFGGHSCVRLRVGYAGSFRSSRTFRTAVCRNRKMRPSCRRTIGWAISASGQNGSR